jgi:uncharacterized protein DUF6527
MSATQRFELEKVRFMPKSLRSGVLYVSDEFGTAAHLCACGCGQKIQTPLGAVEWSVDEGERGPTLHPSVGNWQRSCRSHYWIRNGDVVWAPQWTSTQVERARMREARRRQAFHEHRRSRSLGGIALRVREWMRFLWSRV